MTHCGMPCFQQETAVDDVAREVDTIGYRAVTDIDRGRKGLASLQGPFLVRRALPDRRCVGSSGKLPSQNTVWLSQPCTMGNSELGQSLASHVRFYFSVRLTFAQHAQTVHSSALIGAKLLLAQDRRS